MNNSFAIIKKTIETFTIVSDEQERLMQVLEEGSTDVRSEYDETENGTRAFIKKIQQVLKHPEHLLRIGVKDRNPFMITIEDDTIVEHGWSGGYNSFIYYTKEVVKNKDMQQQIISLFIDDKFNSREDYVIDTKFA